MKNTRGNAGFLPDVRLVKRREQIVTDIVKKSSVVMQRSDKWSAQVGFYRFLSNTEVTEANLIKGTIEHCVTQCQDKYHVLLIEDTTELNLEKHRNRIRDKSGLGLTGNNKDIGFFCHPTLAVDPEDASLIGVPDVYLWHRDEEKAKNPKKNHKQLVIEEKESYRWVKCAIESRKRLKTVKRVTVVQDREGDIYESFCQLQNSGVDFVIRSNYDRKTTEGKLHELLSNLPVIGEYKLQVTGDSKKRSKREAIMEIRYAKIELCRPFNVVHPEKYPGTLPLYVVYVEEKPESVPPGEEPIKWILYTSHTVESIEDALQIVYWYTLRWLIEDFFRTLKTDGLNYEKSELETGAALRKLLIISLVAAIKILQLRQARDGTTKQKPTLVFSEDQLKCMEDLHERFEGKTEKQKNPHPKDNLGWATWLIARLGGWKGYTSQRPAGVETLRIGLQQFYSMYEGWLLGKRRE